MRKLGIITMVVLAAAACETNDDDTPRRGTTSASSAASSSSGTGGSSGEGGLGGQAGEAGSNVGGNGGGLPPPICGDLTINPGEECDDGNNDPGDGCDATCFIESGEIEPNDTPEQASPFAKLPYYAKLDPPDDVDFVSFSVNGADASVLVRTMDLGDGACPKGEIDTFVDVIAADGTTVIASDDDGGEGNCSRVAMPTLTVGDYFVRVKAGVKSQLPTFIYRLRIDKVENVCGDGFITIGETCDDGNSNSGDGCSSACQIEISETETNDTVATANTFSDPWNAVLAPTGDVDIVAVDILASGASLTATTTDQGTNACAAKTLDTVVEILSPDGMTVLASGDDIIGNCGSALATNLAPGKYFVRIKGGSLATYPSSYGLEIVIN